MRFEILFTPPLLASLLMAGFVIPRITSLVGFLTLLAPKLFPFPADLTAFIYCLKLKPKKIIYMSCEPITLARDLNLLKEIYEIENITLFDMFPNTKHVETVCYMIRRDIN